MKPIASILVACVVASCLITITAPLGVESVQGASFTQVKCTNSPVKIRACPHVNCPVLFAYPDNVPVFAAGAVCGVTKAESGSLGRIPAFVAREGGMTQAPVSTAWLLADLRSPPIPPIVRQSRPTTP